LGSRRNRPWDCPSGSSAAEGKVKLTQLDQTTVTPADFLCLKSREPLL
ncbi:hypothetical protein GN958_ATG14074, partial [Phytophthora infestans]